MALNHGVNIVRDGLVCYLDAANPKSYPGNGTTWKDLSDNGNNGTAQGNPTFSNDNNGIFVMGNGKWFDLGNSLYLDNNSPLTACAWMNVSTFSSRDMFLSRNDAVKSAAPYTWLFGSHNGNTMAAYDGSNWRNVSFNFSTNTWYNLVFSFDGNDMYYYVNGSHIGTNPWSFTDSPTGRNTQVGGYSGNTGDIIGAYSNICFYFKSLSQEEIFQNYNALKSRFE